MKVHSIALTIAIATAASINIKANAGPNDFFGSQIGGSADTTQGSQVAADGARGASAAAQAPAGPPSSDYTVDEKRVQRKYKDNLKHAQGLINKGEGMMRSHDDKVAKKGRVLKEIGERTVADLKANNPFPEIASKAPKKID